MPQELTGAPAVGGPARRTGRESWAIAGCLAAALTLGVFAELAGYLPHPWLYLSQVVVVWLAGAFAAGAAARTTGAAAVAGAAFIVLGLVSNTAFRAVLDGPVAVRPMLEQEWPAWVGLAVVLGSSFGVTGRVRVSGSERARAIAAGVLLAAGVAEVGADLVGVLSWGRPVAGVLVVAVAVIAAAVLHGFRARQVTVAVVTALALGIAALLLLPPLVHLVSVV